jgi:N-acetylmuramoyl-L-alanine amidase
MKRTIKYLVVHCTGTSTNTTIESIQNYWKEVRGWKNPGYHYIIKKDGSVINLFPEDRIANGVKGFNENAIHVSYVGGADANGHPIDNRTDAQKVSLYKKLVELADKYPYAIILGHRDFPGVTKRCPSFDVKTWLADYSPDLNLAA